MREIRGKCIPMEQKKNHSRQCGVNTLLLTHEACKKNGKSAVQSAHRHTRTRWKRKKENNNMNERQRTPTGGIGVRNRSVGGQESDRRWWFLSLPLFLIFNAHNMSVGFLLAFFWFHPFPPTEQFHCILWEERDTAYNLIWFACRRLFPWTATRARNSPSENRIITQNM